MFFFLNDGSDIDGHFFFFSEAQRTPEKFFDAYTPMRFRNLTNSVAWQGTIFLKIFHEKQIGLIVD